MKVLRAALGGARAIRRRRRPVDGARRIDLAVSDRRNCSIIGLARRRPAVAEDPRLIGQTADAVTQAAPDMPRHHRQSRFYPSRGKPASAPATLDPDRRLRLALGLGVAAGPGARDAELCRPRAGAAAVRTGGLSKAARAAPAAMSATPRSSTLSARCGPMPREQVAPATERAAGAAGAARQPPQRDQRITWRYSVETLGRLQAEGALFELVAADHAASRERGPRGRQELAGTAADRGRREARSAASSDRSAALAKSGTVTPELALAAKCRW